MTREEKVNTLKAIIQECEEYQWWRKATLSEIIEDLEQETCEDCISRKAVLAIAGDSCLDLDNYEDTKEFCDEIKDLLPVTPTQRWIPISERLPREFEFVNCTCHSLIDDREDWVVETVYIPQPSDSPYSDWGNIPMLNSGDCEVVAWVHRDIPEPYKAESEDK